MEVGSGVTNTAKVVVLFANEMINIDLSMSNYSMYFSGDNEEGFSNEAVSIMSESSMAKISGVGKYDGKFYFPQILSTLIFLGTSNAVVKRKVTLKRAKETLLLPPCLQMDGEENQALEMVGKNLQTICMAVDAHESSGKDLQVVEAMGDGVEALRKENEKLAQENIELIDAVHECLDEKDRLEEELERERENTEKEKCVSAQLRKQLADSERRAQQLREAKNEVEKELEEQSQSLDPIST